MKKKHIIAIACLSALLVFVYFNWKYEVIAFNPFFGEETCGLKVMTWNIHCSRGTDSIRQRKIAELILKENADFVQLNEFNQDSCVVIDSLLKTIYPYTEEYQSHILCGDIFYSKRVMSNSGHVYIPIRGKAIQTIKATIAIEDDSVQIFGVHMASNRYDDSTEENDSDIKGRTVFARYNDGQEARCFQAEWTKLEITKTKHPVLVMGDMNDFNKSKPLDILTSCGLHDSWWEGGNGYGHTFHKDWMRLRIDFILHSEKINLQNIKVIMTNLSDHNPIVAGFSVNN